MDTIRFQTVDEYIKAQNPAFRPGLKLLRQTIRKAAPEAEEVISYNMPAYKLNGILVYFAQHQSHIGFYALPHAITSFDEEIRKYKTSKATIQFPNNNPLPVKLLTKIVKFRVKENLERTAARKLRVKSEE